MAAPSPAPPPNANNRTGPPAWHGYVLAVLITAMVTGAAALWLGRPRPQPITLHPPPTVAPAPAEEPTPTPASIVVFVSGAVQQPGNYALPPDARVGDALAAAGGFTGDANTNAVNQAEHLVDGVQVHVPAVSEPDVADPPAGVSGATRSGSSGIELGTGLIDLNHATLEELESLPGIGPAKAQAIIANRPYASVDDLDRVPNFGPATVDNLRELVTVQ